jgi:DNA-binding CsgD family transcriptional regulator
VGRPDGTAPHTALNALLLAEGCLVADDRPAARAASSGTAPEGVFGGLTSREREVARLAGSGRRSKEIAEQLRVSRRTVEAHLGRIYHKLGVTSRAELARLVAQAA